MVVMKKFQPSIQQDHAKTEEPVRYAKRKTLQVYRDSHVKERANQAMMVQILMIKSNCAGVGCATATFGQVISMCVVPVRVKHSDSDKEVKTFTLLDTCSQGTFVTEDLISNLGVSGGKASINIKTLNGNQKQSW